MFISIGLFVFLVLMTGAAIAFLFMLLLGIIITSFDKKQPKFSEYSEKLSVRPFTFGPMRSSYKFTLNRFKIYEGIYIINDADRRIGCVDVYENATVEQAIAAYVEKYGEAADGVCLAHDSCSWLVLGYVGELARKEGGSNEKI